MTLWQRLVAWGRVTWALITPLEPPEVAECQCCHKHVYAWRTYADGVVTCLECARE